MKEKQINNGYQEFIKFKQGLPYSRRAIATGAPSLLEHVKTGQKQAFLDTLPRSVYEYVEVGEMINSGVYPRHKLILLKDIRLRLLEKIQNDQELQASLSAWCTYQTEHCTKPDRKNRPPR